MRNYIFGLMIFGALCQGCKEKPPKPRECVLDKVVRLEDSIHYRIDSLPMLCGELGMEGKYADIGGCKLYYEEKGEGVPMVLINGGPGGTHHCFHPWFRRAEDYCRVVYYDQRGCGQSDFARNEGYTFRQAVDDLEKLRHHLGIEKWVVCGYSYGGGLAQYYTAAYPEHTAGMVLIGSVPLIDSAVFDGSREQTFIAPPERDRIKELYALRKNGKLNLLQLLYNKELNGDWKRQSFYKPTREEAVRAALYEWVNDAGFNAEMGNSYFAYNFRHVFDGNPVPTLMCEGKWDLTWEETKAPAFKENHPNARLVMFERAGHTIFAEDPDLFFSELKHFITHLEPVPDPEIARWKNHADSILVPQEEFFVRSKEFVTLVRTGGVQRGYDYYRNFKKANREKQLFSEPEMNQLGYDYLERGDWESAVTVFTMLTDAYPKSSNAYDSLGEAWLKSGDMEKAKKYYKKSLELDPANENAEQVLKTL